MASICCAVSDVIFAAKIRSTAEAVGVTLSFARQTDELIANLDADTSLVMVDLELSSEDALAMIRAVCQLEDRPRILCYFPHVNAQLASEAEQAGADQVMPRSKFSAHLPQILAGA